MPLKTRRVAVGLGGLIGLVVLTGATCNWMIYNVAPDPEHPLADVLKRFDLGHEPSVPAFFSASLMLCCAALLGCIASNARERRGAWFLLAGTLLAMAVDEAVMFHEMIDAAIHLFVPTSGIFYFAWVIPALIAVALFVLFFSGFLRALDRRTAQLFVLAGALFVSGAVGMEMVAGTIFDQAATPDAALASMAHVLAQAAEEGLEMCGLGVFLTALLDYIGRHAAGLKLPVEPLSSRAIDKSVS